jgi:hypothetical protein
MKRMSALTASLLWMCSGALGQEMSDGQGAAYVRRPVKSSPSPPNFDR